MDDFPVRIADLLERIATRIRSMTVDRVAGWVRWGAAGIVMAMLGLVAVIALAVGLGRLIGELIGVELGYVVVGGLFLILGAFLWSKRTTSPAKSD